MSKATDQAFADGYQQALKDILTKKVVEGQEAADKWIEDNLSTYDQTLNEAHREVEYAYEAEQDRQIAEHEAQMIAEGRY
jgi:uncharacterized protein YicC (UPF0701 family)